MSDNKSMQGGFLSSLKSSTLLLRLACVLAVLCMATGALASTATTSAKYIAMATAQAGSRVAKWEVRLESSDVPVLPVSIAGIPAKAAVGGHPLILFFQGIDKATGELTGDAFFEVEFSNDSEVTAKFIPKVTVATPTNKAALDVVIACIKFYDASNNDITTGGVSLAPGVSENVTVVIESCTFSDLRIGAYCEQLN